MTQGRTVGYARVSTDDQNLSLQLDALAQFERRLIQERTKAGLAAARARGLKGGRPPLSASDPRLVLAEKLHGDRTHSIDDVCRTLRISCSTYYPYVGK